MIRDKKPYNPPVNGSAPKAEQPAVAVPEQVSENPFVNMYQAVRRAILTLREHPEEPQSPPLFKTIMIDTGQFPVSCAAKIWKWKSPSRLSSSAS